MTTYRVTPIRGDSLPRWPGRPRPAGTTGPVLGLEKGIIVCAIRSIGRRPGIHSFAGQFIQHFAAAATVAADQHRPASSMTMPWRRMMIAPRLWPRTVQLQPLHQNPAGFWVSHTSGQTARRPRRLSRCQRLDQSHYHVIAFDGQCGARRSW
jgi:hypothetical protein